MPNLNLTVLAVAKKNKNNERKLPNFWELRKGTRSVSTERVRMAEIK